MFLTFQQYTMIIFDFIKVKKYIPDKSAYWEYGTVNIIEHSILSTDTKNTRKLVLPNINQRNYEKGQIIPDLKIEISNVLN